MVDWSKQAHVPVVIVSSGMVQIIRTVLENLLEPEDATRMEIIANQAIVHPDGKFEIKFRHPESGFGHDKSKALRIYRDLSPKPTIFFCGDGVR
jgi:2-hydroxy-3-keto-5-methylthiopentenyl-1-phosphate phosphatase